MTEASSGRRAVEAVWRIESARIVGALARYTGDFALAEDLAQEALAEALVAWPRDGIPREPANWLLTVGRRRAIDTFRRKTALRERYAELSRDLLEGDMTAGGIHGARPDTGDLLWDPDRIDDDVLAQFFMTCHPVLSREAGIPLTLRALGGLTSDEIARAFLVPTATVQARITRAKKTLAAAGVRFELPSPEDRRARLPAVLNSIYVIFSEGSSASTGPERIRTDLAGEGIRLARVLARLVPDEPEAQGLLALLELTAARFPARVDENGDVVLLENQNRRRWDRDAIRRGRAALARAESFGRGLGAYGLQAAIAECHAVAPDVDSTDWARIVALYEALGRLAPSPIVDLNRAVAVTMADDAAAGLAIVDELIAAGALSGSHLLPGTRAEILIRLGRPADAAADLRRALELCANEPERRLLQRKLDSLT
ncbi:RNA polymerase sigma factor [Kribbella sp. CA-247076]|uniref:RNA polymerase sigma factor n=1 Tax=Kribbella sp. CA-247076 TaxID=3239941 RepID=UPI003D8C3A16